MITGSPDWLGPLIFGAFAALACGLTACFALECVGSSRASAG